MSRQHHPTRKRADFFWLARNIDISGKESHTYGEVEARPGTAVETLLAKMGVEIYTGALIFEEDN